LSKPKTLSLKEIKILSRRLLIRCLRAASNFNKITSLKSSVLEDLKMQKGFAKFLCGIFVALFVIAFSTIAQAQFRAAVQGAVTDSTGGAVAQA
jgi:hypothetical protein